MWGSSSTTRTVPLPALVPSGGGGGRGGLGGIGGSPGALGAGAGIAWGPGAHGLKPGTSHWGFGSHRGIPYRTITFEEQSPDAADGRWVVTGRSECHSRIGVPSRSSRHGTHVEGGQVAGHGSEITGSEGSQVRRQLVRLGAVGVASVVGLGLATGVAGVGVAGAAGPSGGSGGSGGSATPATLSGIQTKAWAEVTKRVNSLNAAIAKANTAKGLGSGRGARRHTWARTSHSCSS